MQCFVSVECSDIIFAIDSVPAVFSVSTNLLIVYSSNIFAILGLRQMYFVLEHLQERFRYVKYGVGIIADVHGSETGGTDIRFSHIDDCIDLRDLLCDSVQRDNVRDHIGKRREAINHIIEPAEMQRL